MNKRPVLKCFPASETQVKAWCPYCRKWHLHGYLESDRGHKSLGAFRANCMDENSPFKKTGYILKKITKKEAMEISEIIKS